MTNFNESDVAQMRSAAYRLIELGARTDWRGPDPYDGLYARWPGWLIGGARRRQVMIQLHARAPINVRGFYRSQDSLIPKAPALLGLAASRLLQMHDDPRLRQLARSALQTLCDDTACGDEGWGYPWATQTRWSYYPAGSPNVVVTAFSANALAEVGGIMAEPSWQDRARRAAEWVARDLFVPEEGFFAYHGYSPRLVHNANLLGAALVHQLAPATEHTRHAVRSAVLRTLDAQRPDGTWPYGDTAALDWVDSFHTGYVLDSLCRLEGVDPGIPEALERGAHGYVSSFFGADGRAMLWQRRRFPEDSHSAGTGMTVLSTLATREIVPIGRLRILAQRTLTHLLRSDGHAVFRRRRLGASRVHYTRWCDAPVALGLASASALLEETQRLPIRPAGESHAGHSVADSP